MKENKCSLCGKEVLSLFLVKHNEERFCFECMLKSKVKLTDEETVEWGLIH